MQASRHAAELRRGCLTRSALSASWARGTSTMQMVEDTATSCRFRRERRCCPRQLHAHLCLGLDSLPSPVTGSGG